MYYLCNNIKINIIFIETPSVTAVAVSMSYKNINDVNTIFVGIHVGSSFDI
jgi:hypothetical protein